MNDLTSHSRRLHPFDLLMLLASFGMIGWIVLAH